MTTEITNEKHYSANPLHTRMYTLHPYAWWQKTHMVTDRCTDKEKLMLAPNVSFLEVPLYCMKSTNKPETVGFQLPLDKFPYSNS